MYTLMARRAKPNLLPELWMTTGGLRQLTLTGRSRLGDESRDEGLDDRDRDDLGLKGGTAESSGVRRQEVFRVKQSALICAVEQSCIWVSPGVMMRDRPETEADLGTLPDGDLGFSGVSSW